ncbi:MAG: bifunctional diguanylate cyclase/phosphodiesterase [Actinomycetota bacterium]|nr:bifunctional diguanylate cyclase/phosphodiesterase [Actinomycetota bacterium]
MSSPPRRVVARICLLSVALAACAGVATALLPDATSSSRSAPWWVAVVLVFAFALAERSVFHFEFRHEAISFSFSEVPTAFALVYLAPGPAIAVRIIGALVLIRLRWRSPYYKNLFNASLFAIETALAYQVARMIAGAWPDSTAVLLFALVPAVALATLLGSAVVSLAISIVEGGFRERLGGEMRINAWIAPLNAAVAAGVVAPTLMSPWLVALSIVPLVAFWRVLQGYGRLEQRFRDLDDLHGFVGRVGKSLDLDETVEAAADDIAALMRVRRAALIVFDLGGGLRRHDVGPPLPDLPTSVDDPRWRAVLGQQHATLLNGSSVVLAGCHELSEIAQVLAAPVREGTDVVGLVVVAERDGAVDHFRPGDHVRLETLAGQFAPNLRKAILHGRIDFEARHDALTGLPNRPSFERMIDVMIEAGVHADGAQMPVVMLMDLDRFKEVNDTLGHHAGDSVLIDFARRISAMLEPGDLLARLAGDEFALLAVRHLDGIHQLANRLVDEARRPFTIDGLEVVVTMSIGVAPMVGEIPGATTLLRRADIAMYAAKNRHTGYEMYREEIDRRTPARLAMLGDLRNALERDDMQVFLQPKLDLASGVVIGVEALARWSHASRGWVAPEDFVPVAEETGLIKQLTDQVLDSAIEQLQRLRTLGHHLGLAVNLSTHDLLDELLPDRVMRHLDRRGVDPALLTLEITESSLLIDAPRARATIDRINRQGIRLSVDDFGTGYSSLSYLRHLPVSELKIDRSFVANVLLDDQDEVIVRSIIDLGHNLGMQVVAEGVETDEVITRLRGFACDVAQGFGICRALPFDQFVTWLSTTQYPSRRRDPLRPGQWFDLPATPDTEQPRPTDG